MVLRARTLARRIAAACCLCVAASASAAESSVPQTSALQLDVVYTGDLLRNVHGGRHVGGTYLDNLDVMLTLDAEGLWNGPPLQLFAYGLYNNSRTFSKRYAGDALVASNIDASRAIRLYEAWGELSFGEGEAHSLRVGLYDLNSEFDTSEPRQLLMNSAFGIGADISQSGLHGPSIFPVTSLGARLSWRLTPEWRVLGVVLDGVPGDLEDPSATTIRLSERDGVLSAVELQRLADGVLQKLAVGAWRYTSRSESIEGPPERARHNLGAYVSADWQLHDGWQAFARWGWADKRVNEFVSFTALGVVYQRPTSGDREQSVGLGVAQARTGRAFRRAALLAGENIESHETAVELTYRRQLSDRLTLQPVVQYIINPGVVSDLANAWVIGVRLEAGWSPANLPIMP